MAFDAYRQQSDGAADARRHRRRIMIGLSIAVHGCLLAIGIAYSFWHIEELSPPTLRVTFMADAPPPPPPPPPAGGGGPARRRPAIKPRPQTKPPDIVQPRDTPPDKPEPKHDEAGPAGEKGGVVGGKAGGVIGGTIGGTIGGKTGGVIGGAIGGTAAAPAVAKFLPPNMGALQKRSGADPPFPPSLRRSGAVYVVMAKICVNRDGGVESVALMKHAEPQLDENVLRTVAGWRYQPLLANGAPVPFCYFGRFEFRSE